MDESYNDKPVYAHEDGEYFMYWHEDFKSWQVWVEIGSMYAGYFAHGRETKALSSITVITNTTVCHCM